MLSIKPIIFGIVVGMAASSGLSAYAAGLGEIGGGGFADQIPREFQDLGKGITLKDVHPGLLLRIEYPADATSEGLQLWRARYKAEALRAANISGAVVQQYASQLMDEDFERLINDELNKSSYYALRILSYLQKSGRFPPNTIALEGVTIDTDPAHPGELRTLRDDTRVPAVLTLRFVAVRDWIEVGPVRETV